MKKKKKRREISTNMEAKSTSRRTSRLQMNLRFLIASIGAWRTSKWAVATSLTSTQGIPVLASGANFPRSIARIRWQDVFSDEASRKSKRGGPETLDGWTVATTNWVVKYKYYSANRHHNRKSYELKKEKIKREQEDGVSRKSHFSTKNLCTNAFQFPPTKHEIDTSLPSSPLNIHS